MDVGLNRHFVTKEDVKKLEADIAWYKKTIGRYQTIARGDKEGHLELIKLLKDSRDQSQILLNTALRSPSFGRYMKSGVLASEVRVYTFVLGLLEDAKKESIPYQDELSKIEKRLSELRKLPKRD